MKKLITALAIASSALAVAIPAHAESALVNVAQTSNLARTGSVAVTLGNIPAGQGVYVMFCAKSESAARPSACYGRGVWASTDEAALKQGAVSANNSIQLPVAASFTPQGGSLVDCDLVSCGVFVRRDHMGPTDLSLDTFVPVAFVSAVPSKVTVSPGLGRVLVTIAGYKGKTVTVNLAGRVITKQILADSVQFFVGNGGNTHAKVVVKLGNRPLFSKVLTLKK